MSAYVFIVWLEEIMTEEGVFEVPGEALDEECGVRRAEECLSMS